MAQCFEMETDKIEHLWSYFLSDCEIAWKCGFHRCFSFELIFVKMYFLKNCQEPHCWSSLDSVISCYLFICLEKLLLQLCKTRLNECANLQFTWQTSYPQWRLIRGNSSNVKENKKQAGDSSPEYFVVEKFSLSLIWMDCVGISGMFPTSQNVTGQWLPERLHSMMWLYSRFKWKENSNRYKTR